ncbi:glutathione S-transferase [Mycena amicta]|nr:glutathione S-transferase [Mycena amicta]
MVLKLYCPKIPVGGSLVVATVLAEKKVPFELVEVDLKGQEQKSARFVEMHPFGQVPIIDDDGFILHEFRAICRYIIQKYAHQGTQGLMPPPGDLQASAIFEQAVSVESANFHPHSRVIYLEGRLKQRWGIAWDPAALEASKKSLNAVLDVYEQILSKKQYLAGDEMSLVDLFHLALGPILPECGYEGLGINERPNVQRWWTEVSSRPTFAQFKEGWYPQ